MTAGEQVNSDADAENFASEEWASGVAGVAPVQPADRLWAFALAIYSRPAVAPLCLALQDEQGIDINLLLFSAWAGCEGRVVSASLLRRAQDRCRHWRDGVVRPLREQRRQWKDSATHAAEYAAVKTLEIGAERVQLGFLADLFSELALAAESSTPAALDPPADSLRSLQPEPPAEPRPEQRPEPRPETAPGDSSVPGASTGSRRAIRDSLLTLCQHYSLDDALQRQVLAVLGDACAAISRH